MGSYDYFTKPLSQFDLKTVLPLKIKNAVTTRRLMTETNRQNEILRRELEMAARYQEFLLPSHMVELPGVEVSYLFQPCTGVGGDYFDFVPLPGGMVGFVVADVSGHGVASAMTASIVKALMPGYLERLVSPAQALTALNDELLGLTQEDAFVTAFAALYDPKSQVLIWSMAGHPAPVFLSAQGRITPLLESSFFLGSMESDSPLVSYSDHRQPVAPGDRLALYTDGLTEAPAPNGDMFGTERLHKFMLSTRGQEMSQVPDALLRELKNHVQGEFPDDVAFILAGF